MNQKRIIVILIFLLLLILSSCSNKDEYKPFSELSEQTLSPQREAEIQAALNGQFPTSTPEPVVIPPTEPPVVAPTFDESIFFTEVETGSGIEVDAEPFGPEPTATETLLPTETPLPTATRPYDPNIMMYDIWNGLTTYTLQDGDDFVCLARRFNVSVSYLMAQNGISDPTIVQVNDTITLPRSPDGWSMVDGYGSQKLKIHPDTYTVQDGDTLFSIACSYGDVRPEDIAVQNQLVLGEPLPVGLTIAIP